MPYYIAFHLILQERVELAYFFGVSYDVSSKILFLTLTSYEDDIKTCFGT